MFVIARRAVINHGAGGGAEAALLLSGERAAAGARRARQRPHRSDERAAQGAPRPLDASKRVPECCGCSQNYSDSELLVFDDSFFHAAENGHETEARFVLSVDFWKPGLLL